MAGRPDESSELGRRGLEVLLQGDLRDERRHLNADGLAPVGFRKCIGLLRDSESVATVNFVRVEIPQ